MSKLYNLILTNVYLCICILLVLLIFATILFIIISNKKKREQIKKDFVVAEKIEEELNAVPKNDELESILAQMQEDIKTTPEEVVKKFEQEQEEKAIISYQELVDNVKQGRIEIEEEDDGNVDFVEALTNSSEKVEPLEEVKEEKVIDKEDSVTPSMLREAIESIETNKKEDAKSFKQSEFISPIYGRIEPKLDYPTVKKSDNILDIMNTRDYNKLTEEIKKQEEFLNTLIEFRKNL